MRIAAYQFAVCGDMRRNFAAMQAAVSEAATQKAELLIFPECALTGYPPRDIPAASDVDFTLMADLLDALGDMATKHGMHIVVGTITRTDGQIHSSAAILRPDGERQFYHKRALWGWDRDNFVPGADDIAFSMGNFKIGVRICYEVRFPEYFRELYAAGSDLNLALFYDTADADDPERYEIIKSCLRTRAAENVCPILSVNAVQTFQTAPTAFFDASGRVLYELERNTSGLLVCDFEARKANFSEQGRRCISDALTQHD